MANFHQRYGFSWAEQLLHTNGQYYDSISNSPFRIGIGSGFVTPRGKCNLYCTTKNLGLILGAVDASLVPLLANFVDNKGSSQYGPVYAFQQAAVAVAYSFGPLLGGQAVEVLGFPWLMRLVGFANLLFCPLLLELEHLGVRARIINSFYNIPRIILYVCRESEKIFLRKENCHHMLHWTL